MISTTEQQFIAKCKRQCHINWDKRPFLWLKNFPPSGWNYCWSVCLSTLSLPGIAHLLSSFLGKCVLVSEHAPWGAHAMSFPWLFLWRSRPQPDCLCPGRPCMGRVPWENNWVLACWALLALPPLLTIWFGYAKLRQSPSSSSGSSPGGKIRGPQGI